MQSQEFIQSLIEQTRQIINQAEKLKTKDLTALTWRAHDTSWCILECLEHLSLYGDFYLPQFERKIKQAGQKHDKVFKSGWMGNYFAKSMLPREKLNKMKTFKDKNPLHSKLDKTVIDRFLSQQVRLLDILNSANQVSLNEVKIATSISSLIRLKLGDAFQFYINHMIRHMKQVDRVEGEMKQLGA